MSWLLAGSGSASRGRLGLGTGTATREVAGSPGLLLAGTVTVTLGYPH